MKLTACVILNYNDHETTTSLVNRIKNYNSIDYIVVVDNESSDCSYEILNNYVTNKIHLISSGFNGGYGYGNNIGIKYCVEKLKVDYIIISNPDVEFTEQCIFKLREILLINNDVALASAMQVLTNSNCKIRLPWRIKDGFSQVFMESIILNKLFKLSPEYSLSYFNDKTECVVEVLPGAFFMVKADIIYNYALFDEDIFLFFEEQIMFKKVSKLGYKSVVICNEQYLHHHSVTINKTFNSMIKIKKIYLESKCIYLKKYHMFNDIQIFFVDLFFRFTVLELFIWINLKKYILKLKKI